MSQVPVIFLAFANDRVDDAAYLRNLPKELDGIRKALEDAQRAGLCEVVERANVTIEQLLDVFQSETYRNRIAVFHYGGHANGFQLLLEALDGSHSSASTEGLVPFLARQRGLKMVFLNGCSSQQQSLEMIQAGVSAVVGTSQSINDEVATSLAIRFYKGIGQGISLERAWQEATDAIKLEKGAIGSGGGNIRDLFWEGATTSSMPDRFPWEMNYREGAEIVKEWNLPDEVGNPLFNLPPIPNNHPLPESPFLFFNRYERKHASVFFGRSYYIRDLFNKITSDQAPPVILLYGQSGVGKSSLLDAGILPRLEQLYITKYLRRDSFIGLAEGLQQALVPPEANETSAGNTTSILEPELEERKMHLEQLTLDLEERLPLANPVTKEQLQKAIASIQQEIRSLANNTQKGISGISPESDLEGLTGALKNWKLIEARTGKPLFVILDQVEELFTRPLPHNHELEDLLELLDSLFLHPTHAPKGKLMLSYRKEYNPEIEEAFKQHQLPRNRVFIESMGKKDIADIFKGLSETPALQERYHLQVEKELPYIVADDLLEDRDSPVAPILQILMTKLWQEATEADLERPNFTIQMYQDLRRQGILLDDFFQQQMQKLREWAAEVELSGLALDMLHFHTTRLGTAGSKSIDDIRERYQHRQDVLDSLLEKFKELYLLNDAGRGMTGLAHDTIAPLIQSEFRYSERPGQRASRILENKSIALSMHDDTALDVEDLELVEMGQSGMRYWVKKEQALIDRSRQKRQQMIDMRKRVKKVSVGGVLIIIVIALFGVTQWNYSKNLLQGLAISSLEYRSQTLAEENPTLAIGMAKYFYELKQPNPKPHVTENLKNILAQCLPKQTYQSVLLHSHEINGIAFSPNGQYIATAESIINQVKLWSINGDILGVLESSIDPVTGLGFLGNDTVAIGYANGITKWVDLNGSEYDKQPRNNKLPIKVLWEAVNGSGYLYLEDRIVGESTMRGRDKNAYIDCIFHHVSSNKRINIQLPANIAQNIRQINFDGQLVLFKDNTAKAGLSIYHTVQEKVLPAPKFAYEITDAYFSEKLKQVVLLSSDGHAIWVDYEGNVQKELYLGLSSLQHPILSPNEQFLLCYQAEKGAVMVWNMGGEIKYTLRHKQSPKWLGFSPDGQHVFKANANGEIYLWDLRMTPPSNTNAEGYWKNRFSKPISGFLQFAADPNFLIGAGSNDSLVLIDRHAQQQFPQEIKMIPNIASLIFSKGRIAQLGKYAPTLSIAHSNEKLSPLEFPTDSALQTIEWHKAAMSPNEGYVALSALNEFRIWDLKNDSIWQTPTEYGFETNALAIDNELRLLASYNHEYAHWKTSDGQFDTLINIKGHFNSDIICATIAPNGRYWALASANQIHVWDGQANYIEESPVPVENIRDLRFSEDGRRLLIANGKGVYSWHLLHPLLQELSLLRLDNPSLLREVQQELSSFNGQIIYDFSDSIFFKKLLVYLFLFVAGIAIVGHLVEDFDEGKHLQVVVFTPTYLLLIVLPLLLMTFPNNKQELHSLLNAEILVLLPVFLGVCAFESNFEQKRGKYWQSRASIGVGIIGFLTSCYFIYTEISLFMTPAMGLSVLQAGALITLLLIPMHYGMAQWYKGNKKRFYVAMALFVLQAVIYVCLLFILVFQLFL